MLKLDCNVVGDIEVSLRKEPLTDGSAVYDVGIIQVHHNVVDEVVIPCRGQDIATNLFVKISAAIHDNST